MTLTSVGAEVSEVPLPEAELLEGWVPPEGVTQVIIDPFQIYLQFYMLSFI